jgi:phenylacetate-CoA ligase
MSLLDVARGAYVRSPASVRRTLAPLVSLLPTRLKFGRTYRQWRERIARASTDPGYAAEQHLANLRALMQKAHAGSPFYRDLFDARLGHDFDLATLEPQDLQRLPVLRKEELRAAGDSLLTVRKANADLGDTSGSNGERPFTFYLDKDRSGREMAFVYDTWGRIGFSEDTPKIVLRGFGLNKDGTRVVEWEPALRELRLSVFPMTHEDVNRYVDLIDRHELDYLYGYPSAIELMCRHMSRIGRRLKRPLKGILPISEPLYWHQRKTIAEILGPVPIANFYGLSEKALFAREVDDEGTYVFDPLYGLAELVDNDGQPITQPGLEGRLVGTGFLTSASPFVRYDTEDRATLVELPSAANGQRLKVERIIPRRKPDFLISAQGNRVVTIDFTPDSPRYFKGIEEYQFRQETPGAVTIRYIPTCDGTEDDARRVATDLTERTGRQIMFDIEQVAQLAGGRAGKRAFIDQRLDISRY